MSQLYFSMKENVLDILLWSPFVIVSIEALALALRSSFWLPWAGPWHIFLIRINIGLSFYNFPVQKKPGFELISLRDKLSSPANWALRD